MPIELKVTLLDDGRLSVSGPIEDEIFAYGLLEKGRLAIQKHNENKSNEQRIIPAAFGLPPAGGGS